MEMDATEVDALVLEYLPLVERIVLGTIARGVPAYIEKEDLVQECALRLPEAIGRYRGKAGASLKTYLKTVIRRDVMDEIRRQRREPIHSGARSADSITVGIEAVEARNVKERNEQFKRAVTEYSWGVAHSREGAPAWGGLGINPLAVRSLCALTHDQYQAVVLCDVAGMTQQGAAERLGITRNAIASRLRKAHATLDKHNPKKKNR